MSGTRGLKPSSERERTFKTVMNNLKLRVILESRKKEIERDKMTVVNRITLNQRITYKRFKRKLTQAELTHSRIMGDKEKEREVRSSMFTTHMNTNVCKDPEDELVLRRIWAAGSEATSTGRKQRDRPFSVPASVPGAGKRQTQMSATVTAKREAQLAQAQRPHTVSDPTTRSLQRTGPLPAFISTGARQATQSDEEEEEELDDAYNLTTTDEDSDGEGKHKRKSNRRKSSLRRNNSSSTQRAKVAFTPDVAAIGEEGSNFDDDQQPGGGSSRAQSSINNEETRDSAGRRFTIFSDPSEQVTLLDVHRVRLRSAGHEKRVHDLCARMSSLEGDKRYLLPDYYLVCLNEEAGGPGSRNNIPRPVTPESERDAGFVHLPDSLTFKPIDMSFRRRARTAGARFGDAIVGRASK